MEIYLDNSATTRPCAQAIAAMTLSMREHYHNPSALYAASLHAEREMDKARKYLGECVGVGEKNVVFTSGGTESNHLAIAGHMAGQRGEGTVLYSAAEHPSVRQSCMEAAALYGLTAVEIPLTADGSLDLEAFETLLDARVRLICVMQVCNETGVIMPLDRVAQLRSRLAPRAALHVDGVQGFLRVPFSLSGTGAQSYAISGHKILGPKGVGALLTQPGHRLRPVFVGGGQEGNLRSGTENTAGIAGLHAAAVHYPPYDRVDAHTRKLKTWMAKTLQEAIPETRVLGIAPEEPSSAGHILALALPPVRGETLVHALEGDGVLVGTGSACSSKKGKHSPVLTAMGVPKTLMDSAVRISFSPENTMEEAALAAESMVRHYRLLRGFKRR